MTESRIIYVTGMKPKPPPDAHRRALTRVLAAGLARVQPGADEWLRSRAENFVLVSWTSEFYDYRRDIELDLPGIERMLANPIAGPADRRASDSLHRRSARAWHLVGDSYPWLTSLLAPASLKATMAEVHRYLSDRAGVAGRIRSLLREQILTAWDAGERVLLIGHSLGSVIAYDTLWGLSRVERHPGRVDFLLTLGSPIATRFIRKALLGARRTEPERYPANIRRWHNVTARGELVALHPRIAPFFGRMVELGLVESIDDDVDMYNHFYGPNGLDVHKSYGYLNHAKVAGPIAEWIAAGSHD